METPAEIFDRAYALGKSHGYAEGVRDCQQAAHKAAEQAYINTCQAIKEMPTCRPE